MSHAQGHPKKTLLRGLLDKLLVLKIVRLLHSGTIQLRLCASISERRCREQVNRIDRINRPDVAATAATAATAASSAGAAQGCNGWVPISEFRDPADLGTDG